MNTEKCECCGVVPIILVTRKGKLVCFKCADKKDGNNDKND